VRVDCLVRRSDAIGLDIPTMRSQNGAHDGFQSKVSPSGEGDCTARFRLSDTRCGTYVIYSAYLQSRCTPS